MAEGTMTNVTFSLLTNAIISQYFFLFCKIIEILLLIFFILLLDQIKHKNYICCIFHLPLEVYLTMRTCASENMKHKNDIMIS